MPREYRVSVLVSVYYHFAIQKYFQILVCNIYLINMSDSVSDQARKLSALNIEKGITRITVPRNLGPMHVLNTFCTTRV